MPGQDGQASSARPTTKTKKPAASPPLTEGKPMSSKANKTPATGMGR
jgi:hypothetical protein